MQNYTKTYLKYFGYGEQDFIMCEICNQRASEVHHIDNNRKNNNISNLMALCRDCHFHAHGDKDFWSKEYYQEIHNKCLI